MAMVTTPPAIKGKRSQVLIDQFVAIADGRGFGALRSAMAEAGISIGMGTLQRLAAGDTGVRLESIKKLAQFGGMTPEQLIGGAVESEFVEVHRAGVKFSNGHGHVFYEEDDKPPLSFRVDFLRRLGIKLGDAVVVDADGYSNEPKIMEGSVVLVDRGDCHRLKGDFFAFRVNGELLIKRLERVDGVGIVATAENPNFRPKIKVYTAAELEDFEVIGRAVWTGTNL